MPANAAKTSPNKAATNSSSATRRRRFLLALLIITGLALLLRLIVSLELLSHPSLQSPQASTDMATYRRLALDIRQGLWPDHFDYQPLYYSLFLPLIYLIAPGSALAVALIQTLLGAAAVYLSGLCAAQLFGRRAGIAAALLLALSRFHIFYTPILLLEVLLSFLMILLLWLTLRAWRRNRTVDWLATAFVCALATLTRGNALLMLPGIALLLTWRNRHQPRRAALLCLLGAALFYLPQLPYAWRNYRYMGHWCGASTASGKVLALGNTPEAPPGGLEYPLSYHRWVSDADNPDPALRISVPSRIIRWFIAEPHMFCELKWRALLLFWDHREIPNNVSIDHEGQQSLLLRLPILLPFAVISSLTLLGFMLLWRRPSPARYFLFYLVAVYCLSTVLFYILARFRIGGLPLFCVMGGGSISASMDWYRRRQRLQGDKRRQQSLAFALKVVIALFLACGAFAFWQTNVEPGFMRRFRPHGIQADFADTALLYDHGPLSVGGLGSLEIPEDGLRLEKSLVVPEKLRTLAPGTRVCWRLPVLCNPDARWSAQLSHGGKHYPLGTEALRKDRFLTWLEIELPALLVQEDGLAQFSLQLNAAPDTLAIGIDNLRDYGRSRFYGQDGKLLPLAVEAACELQFYHP
jgi:4-amino-4-deoxy-L-arabinose transferase-like glycosyltransferase